MGKGGHGIAVNTSHTSHTHLSRSSGPHSMIKSSKWWPTAFHWNGPPPDIIKPGRTQIPNGLPNVNEGFHKRLIWWERQTQKPEYIVLATWCISWIMPLTSTQNASTSTYNARKRMVLGYLCIQCRERLKHARSGNHLHMMPRPTLTSWVDSKHTRLLDLTRY